jgi:phage gp36-like protein
MARAREPETLDDVEYRDLDRDGDGYFTGEGKKADDDDFNSESDTVGNGDDDIQTRPVSSLQPRDAFNILQRWWFADADASADWRTQATDDLGFVAGEQLSTEDKQILDEANRPHVVFNRFLAIIKAIAGMEINGRHEIVFNPTETDDTVVSEILSGASRSMSAGCDAEDEQSEAFQQTAVTGIGVTESRWSYELKSRGQYLEEQFDCREFFWDRTARKKNLIDARRMWRCRRMPLSDAMQMFPGKSRRQLDASWADSGIYNDSGPRSIEEKRIRDGKNSYLDWDDTNEVTIVCGQWWEREPYYLVADEGSQSLLEMSPKEFRLLKRLRILQGQKPIEGVRMTKRAYKQVFLGNELLGKVGAAPMGQQFSWGVITGEWDAKKRMWYGLTRVVRDPQKWANKFMSQVMHIMNATAKGGILAERSAFDDEIEAEEGYAQPDMITWLKDGALSGQKPKLMAKPGAGDASAYVALLQYAVQAIPQVTGVNFELLGQQDIQNPGVVEAMRKQAGMTVLATLFDALRRYRKILGRIRLEVIQKRMSDGRIVRIVGQQYQGAVQLAKSVTAGEFDVTVDDAPTSPNQKEANWMVISTLLPVFKDQLMAQPEVLAMVLEYSPLPSQLVSAIKRIILAAQSDPQKQQEQQQVKELTVARLLSEVSKNDSIANMNNAKAGSAQGTAAYDIAIAQNMQHDNALQRGKLVIDAKKADADTVLTHAKAAATLAGIHHDSASSATDILNARTKHIEAADKMHTNRVGALAGAHHDLASAFQKRMSALIASRTPVQPPGG